jgi:hypothetical protein
MALGGLLFAFFSLLIGKMFIQKRNSIHALDTLWYVASALLISCALGGLGLHWRMKDRIELLQNQLDELRNKYEES